MKFYESFGGQANFFSSDKSNCSYVLVSVKQVEVVERS